MSAGAPGGASTLRVQPWKSWRNLGRLEPTPRGGVVQLNIVSAGNPLLKKRVQVLFSLKSETVSVSSAPRAICPQYVSHLGLYG